MKQVHELDTIGAFLVMMAGHLNRGSLLSRKSWQNLLRSSYSIFGQVHVHVLGQTQSSVLQTRTLACLSMCMSYRWSLQSYTVQLIVKSKHLSVGTFRRMRQHAIRQTKNQADFVHNVVLLSNFAGTKTRSTIERIDISRPRGCFQLYANIHVKVCGERQRRWRIQINSAE